MGPGSFSSLCVQEGDGVAGPWSLSSDTSRLAASSSRPWVTCFSLGLSCPIKRNDDIQESLWYRDQVFLKSQTVTSS